MSLVFRTALHITRLRRVITMVCLAGFTAQARVIYVNGNLNTDPVPDGNSWATAWAKVQEGIESASADDDVWVARGIYLENIVLKPGVAIYGGFVGTETNRAQRDWTNPLTILDGRQSNS